MESKWLLPEHREGLIQHNEISKIKQRPILDEQRGDELAHTIATAMFTETMVYILVFDAYQDKVCIGWINKIDRQLRRLKLICGGEIEWIKIDDIICMELR